MSLDILSGTLDRRDLSCSPFPREVVVLPGLVGTFSTRIHGRCHVHPTVAEVAPTDKLLHLFSLRS